MKKLIVLLTLSAVALSFAACGDGKPDAGVSATEAAATTVAATEAGTTADDSADKITIVPTAASGLKLVEKDTEAFTMQIPEGWELRYGWDGEKLLMIRVYDPEQPVNQIFYATDMVPFMKNQKSADMYAASGMKLFSEAPILDPPKNETLFKQIPKLRTYFLDTKKLEASAELIPEMYNFQLLESMNANSAYKDDSFDDSVIYGTFRTADASAEGEGIGFGAIVDLYGNMESPLYGEDMSYYNVYSFTAITSVKDEFVNYQDILCKSFSTPPRCNATYRHPEEACLSFLL